MRRQWFPSLLLAVGLGIAVPTVVVAGETDGNLDDDLPGLLVLDEHGDPLYLNASASFLPDLGTELQQVEEGMQHIAGVEWAVDDEGLDRPDWIREQVRSIEIRIARLFGLAANTPLDSGSVTALRLSNARSTLRRLGTAQSRRAVVPAAQERMDLAAAGGTVVGTVTDDLTAQPIKNILLMAWQYQDGLVIIKKARTDASGAYKLAGLAAGKYYIEAIDAAKTAVYAAEFYDDLPWHVFSRSTPVIVKEGITTAGIDFGLERGGRILGTVTYADTGLPARGAALYLAFPAVKPGTQFTVVVTTDSNGQYDYRRLAGPLNALVYRLWCYATEGYVDMGYDGVYVNPGPGFSSLTPIDLQPGETRRIDFSLVRDAETAMISGKVTERASGASLPGVIVEVWDIYDRMRVAQVQADAGGFYSAGPFWSGVYGLVATPSAVTGYATQVYKNRGVGALYTPVTAIADQDIDGIDFALEKWGGIAGKVYDQSNKNPIQPGLFIIYVPIATPKRYYLPAYVDEQGRFTHSYLNPQNDYRVFTQVDPGSGYVDEMYKNISCGETGCDMNNPDWDWSVGTKITVRSGETTGNINIGLAK
ncbi:MAG: carboxypeptidase regulatory-like domain-containing protein [Acidobacteria bacterium]|nr:carboxypeptidase regulatory-like domain-containing protein [Acidobacteriota bacterium]